MKLLASFVLFIVFIIALVFSVLNFQPVSINLYFFSISLPLTVALMIELLFGVAIGFLGAWVNMLKLKSQFAQANKK